MNVSISFELYLVCALLAFFVFPSLPNFPEDLGGEFSLIQVLVLSVTVSLLELVPIRLGGVVINDNLYVPAVTSAVALMIR